MSDWKLRGYVPDSEEDEDDFAILASSNRGKAASATITGGHGSDGRAAETEQIITETARGSIETIAEQLENTLATGLHAVRNILGSRNTNDLSINEGNDSPLSSLPSSLASSPRLRAISPNVSQQSLWRSLENESRIDQHGSRTDVGRQRNLRIRNPIQLHPYMLEDAKYRTLMQARGIRPVHLPRPQASNEAVRAQDDSQDTELFLSSQGVETQSVDVPSSPASNLVLDLESQSPVAGLRRYQSFSDNVAEDELPDIAQLVRESRTSRKKVYKRNKLLAGRSSNHVAGQIELDRLYPNLEPNSLGNDGHDGFEIPPSPPSSDDAGVARPLSRRRAHLHLTSARTPPALPTPLISSDGAGLKRPNSSILHDTGPSSDETSSEESVSEVVTREDQKLQGMTRRIKGVLPASWLRLDLKKQSKPQETRKAHPSPTKLSEDKGVARRVTSIAARHEAGSGRAKQPIFDLGDDSSEDDSPRRSPKVDEDLPQWFHMERLPRSGEAEEENQIDEMLPAQPRMSKVASGSRRQQQRLSDVWDAPPKMRKHLHVPKHQEQTSAERRTRNTKRKAGLRKRQKLSSALTMNVLDAPALKSSQRDTQPQFLKVAARQARRRPGVGGLPITKKFFQFSTTEETEEVSEVVKGWTVAKHQEIQQIESIAMSTGVHSVIGAAPEAVYTAANRYEYFEPSQQLDTDLRALKESTHTLLNKISKPEPGQKPSQIASAQPADVGQHVLPPKKNMQFVFPHRNRSGHGQLLSRTGNLRPAQLENSHRVAPSSTLHIPRKTPRRNVSITKPQPTQQTTQTHMSGKSLWSKASSAKPKIQRRPHKGIPRKLDLPLPPSEKSPVSENSRSNEMAFPADMSSAALAYSYDASTFPSQQAERLLKAAVAQMKLVFPFDQNTRFSDNIIGGGMLSKAVLRYENRSVYGMRTRDSESVLNNLCSESGQARIGSYDERARRILDESHRSLIKALDTWDMVSASPLAAIESIIEYTERSLCFPEGEIISSFSMADSPSRATIDFTKGAPYQHLEQAIQSGDVQISHRQYFIMTSVNLIYEVSNFLDSIRYRDHGAEYKNGLRMYNYLMIHGLQLYGISSDLANLPQDIEKMLLLLMNCSLSLALQRSSLDLNMFRELETFHRPASRSLTFTFNADSVEAITVLTVWHISQRMSEQVTAAIFYEVLITSIERWSPPDHVSVISIALITLCYTTRFTALDPDGNLISNLGERHLDVSGWSSLLPLVPKVISYFRTMDRFHAAVMYRELLKDMIEFIFRLIAEWQWQVTPTLVKTLLEVYSFNDMVPFEFRGDAVGIFYNHQVIEDVPEYDKNDYDKFLDLVHKAIELQQLLHEDEAGSREAISAKELRGLVYSLIPNNAQLYDAREDLQAEQFLALKNHFALYIALYRSSPEGCGPRIQQLEQQVDLEYSHLMVCKLALKVWGVIAQHEVKRPISDTRALRQIGQWYCTTLAQLERRHLTGQSDAKLLHVEFLQILSDVLKTCGTEPVANDLLSPTMTLIRPLLTPSNVFGSDVTRSALTAIGSYAGVAHKRESDDSTLVDMLLPIIKDSMQKILGDANSGSNLVESAISTWFEIALSLVKSRKKMWFDYIEPRSSLSLDQLGSSEAEFVCDMAKEFFHTKLVKAEKDSIFLEHRQTIFVSWVVSLLSPLTGGEATKELTVQILTYGGESLQLAALANNTTWSPKNLEDVRLSILQHLIQNIYGQQGDPESEWLAGGLDENDLLRLLLSMSSTMKRNWKALQHDPVAQNDYTSLVQAVVNEMEIYPFRGFKLDSWFADGKEFPRPTQTFDNMFKCRFGEEGVEIAKSSIVTLRMKSIEALKFRKQDELSTELSRVFCCTDLSRTRFTVDHLSKNYKAAPEYSVDLTKQTQFLLVVAPVYIEQAAGHDSYALAVLPLLSMLCHLTRNITFRVDNLEPSRMLAFISTSVACLAATKRSLGHAGSTLTPATHMLLEYARLAVQASWSLAVSLDLELSEQLHGAFVTNVFGIAEHAGALLGLSSSSTSSSPPLLPSSRHSEIEQLVRKFSDCFALEDIQHKVTLTARESVLREFVARDLQEGLAGMGWVQEVGFDRKKVEREAAAYLDLVEGLPLLPAEEDDEEDFEEEEM